MAKQRHDQGVKKALARKLAAAARQAHDHALWRVRRSSWPYLHVPEPVEGSPDSE